jgi:hypothetical protein
VYRASFEGKDLFVIRSTLRAAAIVLVAASLVGCGQESRPVAHVGPHTLTVGDFMRAARRAGDDLRLPAEQARPMLLEEMVKNELVYVAAEAHGLDTTIFTRQRRRAATDQALLAALAAQMAPLDPGVSEAEVRTLYDWRKTQSDLQLVYAPDSTTVEIARRRIAEGEPVERAANEFGGASVLPPGGRLGLRVPGSFPQPIDDAMRTQPVGRIGGPYRTSVGWFLVRVLRRAPASVGPFEQERAALENLVRQRKRQAALVTAVGQLVTGYHLDISADAGQRLFRILTPGRVGGLGNDPPSSAEMSRVLARFEGGAFTVADAWEDLGNPALNKPNSSLEPSLREWVRDRTVVRIALAEARRRHLDEDPAVAGPLADQMKDYILRGEYENVASAIAPPDEATLRATWEPVKDRFPMVREARVLWVLVADTAKAMAIGQRAGQGSLREVLRAVDPAIVVHEEALRFPGVAPQWAAIQGELQRLEPGQWANPQATATGFRLLQLVDKVMGPLSWEQLPAEMRQSLANNLVQRSRDARVAAYTDSLRRALNPVLFPEALRGVPWPVPGAGTP